MKCDWYFHRIAAVDAVHRQASGKQAVGMAAVLLLALACMAQQPAAIPVPDGQPANTATLPEGTRISLQVMHPIATRLAHPGDGVDLQVTTPVSVGDKVLVPPGAYVKATLDTITQTPDRTELHIYLNSLVWPNGYALAVIDHREVVTSLPGSIYEHPDYEHPGNGKAAAVLLSLPLGGLAIGALAGGGGTKHSTPPAPAQITLNPPFGLTPPPLPTLPSLPGSSFAGRVKGMAIGGAVGAIAGFAIAAPMLRHHRNVVLDVGAPTELVLQNPLEVDANRAADAVRQAAVSSSLNPIVRRGGCAPGTGIAGSMGTPGTPDTVIPGTPGTPDTVIPGGPDMPATVIPGTPATPATVIPGTPGTPGTPDIPCVPVP